MNPELEQRIRSDLLNSGYGSEMRAAKAALDAGWRCSPSASYFDLEEKKTREIDLNTYKTYHDSELKIYVEYQVLVEVKSSKQPWIVFSREVDSKLEREGWSNPSAHAFLPLTPATLSDVLNKTSLTKELGWIGYGVHELCKSPNQPSRWYAAAIVASKAAAYNASVFYPDDQIPHPEIGEAPQALSFENESLLAITQPVVVIDASLVRAWLDEAAEIQLEEVDVAPLRLNFRTMGHLQRSFRVDLVTLRSFGQYLERQAKRFDVLCASIREGKQGSYTHREA